MEFKFQGFDTQSHYTHLFPTALSSSSNYTVFPGHALTDGGGSLTVARREVEKERIREEIIAAEIERRRVLVAEVRRELMMVREMMALQTGGGFTPSLKAEAPMNYQYPLEPEMMHGERFTPEHRRIATPFVEMYGGGGSHGGFEAVPFQRRPPSPKIKEIRTSKPEDGRKAIIGLGIQSGTIVSGSKRKVPPPPPPVSSPSVIGGSSGGSSRTSKKKITKEWICMVCSISVTSQLTLNEHLSGKKHKAQIEASKANNDCTDIDLGKINKQPSSTKNPFKSASVDLKEDEKIEGESMRKRFRFWCSTCAVGADDEKVMKKHKNGKKHLKNLLTRARRKAKSAGRKGM